MDYYERDIETAIVALLEGKNIATGLLRSTEQLSTPYVEALFELGAPNGHIGADGRHDMFDGQITASVVTDRDRNPEAHYELMAKVRKIMLFSFSTSVTGYTILNVTPNGSTYEIEEDLDVTQMRFAFQLMRAV